MSVIIFCLGFTGCFDLIERTYWSEGNYIVRDNAGNPSSKTLYFNLNGDGIGRVNNVSRLGADDRFIIVESHNNRQTTEKNYWILDKEKDDKFYNSNDIVEGPFTLKEFSARKEKLGIEKLDFAQRFE